MIVVIGINWNEVRQSSYAGFYVCHDTFDERLRTEFNTGDPVKDAESVLKFLEELEGIEMVCFSSSFDDFVRKKGPYEYDEERLIAHKEGK